ncbi:MAG: carbohydrate kinase [Anaerolineae bacterium]|nr:carbohydrate kinase [Anaerolineae bacterium]
MNAEPLLAGLDVGTTNIKAWIFTPDGQPVAKASRPTPTLTPQPGWAEFEPEAIWQTAAAALREATAQVDARRIASIAVASMGEAGVPLDAHNQPLFNAIAWFDPRTKPQADWLEQILGKDALFGITGLSLQPIFSLCKLLWLKQARPDLFERTTRYLHMAEYVAFRLSGEQAADYSLASRTLALDLGAREWSQTILEAAGIPAGLYAPLCVSGTRLGTVTPEASAATGLPVTTQVAAGGHDHVCGALAAGVIQPGAVCNSHGTSETMFVSLGHPLSDPKLGREGYTQGAHVVPDLYYVFGALYTSSACVEWFKHTLAENADYATLIAEAEAIPAGSQGVCFLPHLQFATPPYDDPLARGAFIGLGTDVGRGALFRAVLEGTAFDARLLLEALLTYPGVPEVQAIYTLGGATRNALWMQIKASVLNRPLSITQISDATCLGAAMLGGIGAGIYPDVGAALAALRRDVRVLEPEAAQAEHYEAIYQQVFRGLYPALRMLHHRLEALKGVR